MSVKKSLSLPVAFCLFSITSFAQQLGTIQQFTIAPTVKMESYTSLWLTDEMGKKMGKVYGYERVKSNELARGSKFLLALDGSLAVTEEPWTGREKLEGEVGVRTISEQEEVSRMAFLIWDKSTGIVDLVHQLYNSESRTYEGPRVKLGTIPLDPKSYKGNDLRLQKYASPDGSKVLLYFDGIQSQGIKLAMCWVVDTEGEPIWSGYYRLPVQALGAETTTHFNDAGQVLVEVTAIVLDEENTHEKRDGTLKAEVEKNYWKKTSTTAYLLFGEQFRTWDGNLKNDAETTYMKLLDTPKGWCFVAGTRTGKRKDATHTWVLGSLDSELNPEVVATGPLNAPLEKVLYEDGSAFYLLSMQDDGLAVVEMDQVGTIAWRHVAPFPKLARMDDFRILAGRPVHFRQWMKGDVETLQKGKAPLMDTGGYSGYPALIVWHQGQRTITPLLPLSTRSKDLPSSISLYEEGLFMQRVLSGPDVSFLPITWD